MEKSEVEASEKTISNNKSNDDKSIINSNVGPKNDDNITNNNNNNNNSDNDNKKEEPEVVIIQDMGFNVKILSPGTDSFDIQVIFFYCFYYRRVSCVLLIFFMF